MAETESKKLIGVFEPGGIDGKKPSEMTDDELGAWAEAMWIAAKSSLEAMTGDSPPSS